MSGLDWKKKKINWKKTENDEDKVWNEAMRCGAIVPFFTNWFSFSNS